MRPVLIKGLGFAIVGERLIGDNEGGAVKERAKGTRGAITREKERERANGVGRDG